MVLVDYHPPVTAFTLNRPRSSQRARPPRGGLSCTAGFAEVMTAKDLVELLRVKSSQIKSDQVKTSQALPRS